jgi:pimeloyl-ACP methyl ester carboxylesterase
MGIAQNKLLRPWWWFLDYLYALGRQGAAIFSHRPPPAYGEGIDGLPVIILLPGVYETWVFLDPPAARLSARGFSVQAVPELAFNIAGVEESATTVGEELVHRGIQRCILLAHSKGGLIGKQLMLNAPPGVEIIGMVAVSTPFSGSNYARYMLDPILRSFSPRDRVLMALQEQLEINVRITSIYADFDPHIPERSELSGATNVELPVAGHFRLLSDPTVLSSIDDAVDRLL